MLSEPVQTGYPFDDGLQLAGNPCGEEKYPGRLHHDPLYPLDRDSEGLELSNEEYTNNGLGRSSQGFKADQQSQKQAVRPRKKFTYIISVAVSLIIIAAIVGGVVGSRKAQANQEKYGT